MTLELELTPEQTSWLRQTAAQTGVDERRALLAALDRQRAAEDPLAGLSDDEAQLCREIGQQLPEQIHERRRLLSRQCQEGSLTAAEHRELVELIDIVEADHAGRLARVAKLARLRGKEFDGVAQEFDLLMEVN